MIVRLRFTMYCAHPLYLLLSTLLIFSKSEAFRNLGELLFSEDYTRNSPKVYILQYGIVNKVNIMAGKKGMKGSKGLELPLNMIVLIIVAVLVLLVIAAYFTGQFASGANTIALQSAFNDGCTKWRSVYNCQPNPSFTVKYQAPGSANADTSFIDICTAKKMTITECAIACGCGP